MKIRLLYNEPLFVALPRLIGTSQRNIGESIGLSRMWYKQSLERQDMMLRHLVTLCNVWNINIMSFIVDVENFDNPDLNYRKTDKPTIFKPSKIRYLWRDRLQPVVMRKQLQEDGKWNKLTIRAFTNDAKSTLCIRDWIFMCNQYGLEPDMIFKE